MPDIYKSVSLKPLNGVLDNRSMPEDTASGHVRHRLNFQQNSAGRMGRAPGFEKFLSKLSGYNNEDLHDQMLAAQIYYADLDPAEDGADDVRDYPPGDVCATIRSLRAQLREHITLLYQAISTSGGRYWIVGTQSRLYELNVSIGAYRLLVDGLGGQTSDTLAVRFHVGQVKDTLVFTNDVDKLFSYTLGDEIAGCAMRATRSIPDLDLIKLSKARDIIGFKGHILLFNVVMDGGRLEHRYVWSDFMLGAGSLKELVPGSATTGQKNDPNSYRASVSFDPAIADTIAGYGELPFGHKLLRAIEFNGVIVAFTNRGIFNIDTTGAADRAFLHTRKYSHPDGAACLFYPNTLINCGDCLRYMGKDGIYRWDAFTIEPEREDWLHKGTGVMFASINAEACEAHCAGYGSRILEGREERCIEFSYAEQGHDVPSHTLVVWPEQHFVSPGDYGMTAYGNCNPDARPSINDFLRQYCLCGIDDLSQEYIKSGLPTTNPECEEITSIISDDTQEVDIGDSEVAEVEDYDGAASETSLCAALGDLKLDDVCLGCESETIFVGASSRDKCLKQIGTAFSREVCLNSEVTLGALNGFAYTNARGVYVYEGYYSKLIIGPHPLGAKDIEKNVRNVMLELEHVAEANRNVIALRVGYSYSPLDPNKEDCGVVWGNYLRKELKCPQSLTPAQYRAKNLRPDHGVEWSVFKTGRFLYFEFTIAGVRTPNDLKSDLVPCIGGESYFSSVVAEARKA